MKQFLILGGGLAGALLIAGVFWFQASKPISSAKPPIHKFKSHYPLTPEEEAMMKWRAETIARDPASDWKSSIKFYGLVIDGNNQPLPGANVNWITTNVTGNGQGSTTTGHDGDFL